MPWLIGLETAARRGWGNGRRSDLFIELLSSARLFVSFFVNDRRHHLALSHDASIASAAQVLCGTLTRVQLHITKNENKRNAVSS